jgi:hypothetical protein
MRTDLTDCKLLQEALVYNLTPCTTRKLFPRSVDGKLVDPLQDRGPYVCWCFPVDIECCQNTTNTSCTT